MGHGIFQVLTLPATGLGASRAKTQGNISEPSVLEDRQSNGRRGRWHSITRLLKLS